MSRGCSAAASGLTKVKEHVLFHEMVTVPSGAETTNVGRMEGKWNVVLWVEINLGPLSGAPSLSLKKRHFSLACKKGGGKGTQPTSLVCI